MRVWECQDAAKKDYRVRSYHRLPDCGVELRAQCDGYPAASRGRAGCAGATGSIPLGRLYDEAAQMPALWRPQAFRHPNLLKRLDTSRRRCLCDLVGSLGSAWRSARTPAPLVRPTNVLTQHDAPPRLPQGRVGQRLLQVYGFCEGDCNNLGNELHQSVLGREEWCPAAKYLDRNIAQSTR